MPIYEYGCLACRKRTSVFVRSVSSPVDAACEHCGSKKMRRLMSKFAVHRGSGGGDDDFGGFDGMDDVDESDPRSVARWARRMREEAGDDMGPEFDEMIDRMEAGEMPDDIAADGDDGFDDDDF